MSAGSFSNSPSSAACRSIPAISTFWKRWATTPWFACDRNVVYGIFATVGDLIKQFAPYGFLRVHRNHAVNLARIQEIRRRKGREDWEVKLEPPVNRILPVSRGQIGALLKSFRSGK